MRATFRVIAFASAALGLPTAANAIEDKESAKVAARNGPYLGVQPGVRDNAPGKIDVRSRGAVRVVTWVGFQMQGAGGRVFLQTTEPAVYNLVPSAADEVVLELADTRLQSHNDGRKLETGFFPTAVAWVDADQVKRTTRVVVKLREVVGYDLRQEGNYLILDFRPPTQPLSVPGAPVEAAPVEAAPVEAAPVEAAPVEAAPVEAAPIDPAPADPVPPDAPVDPAAAPP